MELYEEVKSELYYDFPNIEITSFVRQTSKEDDEIIVHFTHTVGKNNEKTKYKVAKFSVVYRTLFLFYKRIDLNLISLKEEEREE